MTVIQRRGSVLSAFVLSGDRASQFRKHLRWDLRWDLLQGGLLRISLVTSTAHEIATPTAYPSHIPPDGDDAITETHRRNPPTVAKYRDSSTVKPDCFHQKHRIPTEFHEGRQ